MHLLVRHNAVDYALGSASSYLSYLTCLWMGDFPALARGLMALDVRVARISSTAQSSSALRVGPEGIRIRRRGSLFGQAGLLRRSQPTLSGKD